jgi:uncharacterized short protein YbdD (DUF466 family)
MRRALNMVREAALLMVGQPNYQAYLRHMAERHPEGTPMTRIEFFRDREQARYGGKGGGRCC